MTVRLATTLLIALLSAAGCLSALADERSVQEQCRDLVMDYAYFRDHKDADALAALFTDDAELSVLGDVRTGREAIRQRLMEAPGNTVHLMSTVRITPVSDAEATGVSYVTVYVMPPGDDPHTVDGWAGIGEYHDTFRKSADGWKIAKRTLVLRLRDAGFKPPAP